MAASKSTPRDAQVMAAIMKDMGVSEYEPRVINQMLEFAYRYITDVLDEAKIYSNHANKRNIDVEDVKLAIQCKLDHSFTTPPPRDLLLDLARHKNNTALPLVKPYTGLKLPPLERYCLVSPNYRLKTLKKGKAGSLLPSLTSAPRLTVQHSGGTSLVRPGGNITVTRSAPQPTVAIRSSVTPSPAAAPPMPIFRLTTGSSAPGPSQLTLPAQSMKRKRDDEEDYDK